MGLYASYFQVKPSKRIHRPVFFWLCRVVVTRRIRGWRAGSRGKLLLSYYSQHACVGGVVQGRFPSSDDIYIVEIET